MPEWQRQTGAVVFKQSQWPGIVGKALCRSFTPTPRTTLPEATSRLMDYLQELTPAPE